MPKLRKILLPLLLSLTAISAAAAATLGTIWCARRDRPYRGVIFVAALVGLFMVYILMGRKLGFLMVMEGMYLMLFLFVRTMRLN